MTFLVAIPLIAAVVYWFPSFASWTGVLVAAVVFGIVERVRR